MAAADLCIATHATDPDRPRRALDGEYLCHGHKADLVQLVAEMPAVHDDLDRPVTPGPKAYGGGSDSYGLTIDNAAADLRRAMADTLASWCRVVVEDRGVHPPTSSDIHHTAPWLVNERAGHLDWCAANRWVDEMLGELRKLTSRARGVVDLPTRRVPLESPCRVHVEGQPCIGTVTIRIRGDEWTADCPVCRERAKLADERYVPQDATPYVRALGGRNQWITYDGVIQLAQMVGISCSHEVVRQWHHRRKITGQRLDDGTFVYEVASVNNYLITRERIAS